MKRDLERWLTPGPRLAAVADPGARVMVSLIFIIGGFGHFGQHADMLARMAESPWAHLVNRIGDPSVLLWLSGAVFVVAGTALAIGSHTRTAAVALFLTLIPVTIAIHVVPDRSHVGPLFKNVAILGALLHFWARGPGAFAIDNRPTPAKAMS